MLEKSMVWCEGTSRNWNVESRGQCVRLNRSVLAICVGVDVHWWVSDDSCSLQLVIVCM